MSKDVIAKYTAEQVYSAALSWAEVFDKELASLLVTYKDLSVRSLGIERAGRSRISELPPGPI